MRISDWSSDVCSSDLGAATRTSGPAASRQGRSRTSALADGLRGAGVALFRPHLDLAEPDGQADQFGQRAGAHLLHDVGPVHLDGALADAEVVGDLLVPPAVDPRLQHLHLAVHQPLVALEDGVMLGLVAPPPPPDTTRPPPHSTTNQA